MSLLWLSMDNAWFLTHIMAKEIFSRMVWHTYFFVRLDYPISSLAQKIHKMTVHQSCTTYWALYAKRQDNRQHDITEQLRTKQWGILLITFASREERESLQYMERSWPVIRFAWLSNQRGCKCAVPKWHLLESFRVRRRQLLTITMEW